MEKACPWQYVMTFSEMSITDAVLPLPETVSKTFCAAVASPFLRE